MIVALLRFILPPLTFLFLEHQLSNDQITAISMLHLRTVTLYSCFRAANMS